MEAILKFNLPEDIAEYELANNAAKYNLALYTLSTEIRRMIKYEQKESITLEELRELFYTTLSDADIHDDSL
jgi:hypothetical protein